MSFLPTPTEDFEVPSKSSQFMKLKQGDNTFRILSKCYEGFLIFTEESKPVRKRITRGEDGKILKGCEFSKEELINHKARKEKGKEFFESPKYFWMFLVYNFETKDFQVLEVSQKAIINTITGYLKNEDWADPKTYNLTITKKGSGLETEYTVINSAHKPLPQEVSDSLVGLEYNIDRIFDGGYPFD